MPLTASITGTVKDADGQPLIGAIVSAGYGKEQTATDLNGSFTLPNTNPPATLVTTYMGLAADTTTVATASIDIVLDREQSVDLGELTVVRRALGTHKMRGHVGNIDMITSSELKRAACCNLGESFTTNPSVDVSYSDAATGARQIKLLGLSGTYVQMLTENIPNFRGAAAPFGLGYIAGPWMQSIAVSKGASSVKNGYESVTGQINIELKKPQDDQGVSANAYADINGKVEINADGNIHLTPRLSTGLLLHGENAFASHDDNNDGFIDMPKVRQVTAMNRWAWMGDNYVFQAAVRYLDERRTGGQDTHHSNLQHTSEPYEIQIDTHRWEAFTKNAYIFDKEHDGNVALILSGSIHDQDATYGKRLYDVMQHNFYASLMFERKWGKHHALSTGASFNFDHFNQNLRADASRPSPLASKEIEAVPGAYVQYTFNLDTQLLLMAGLRYDHSSLFGSMITPRFHAKWNPNDKFSLHGSVGRGYRTPHILAENNYLLASSRRIIIDDGIKQEDAWNYGIGGTMTLPVFNKTLTFNAEYYYTDFNHQMLADMDSDPHAVHFRNLDGRSFSHTLQVDATYPFFPDFTFTAAYRYTDVMSDYGNGLVQKPLTNRHRGLFTASYAPMMGKWQFDVTLALNGGGRMPSPYITASGIKSWDEHYKGFEQLSAQITRNFPHWSIYIGGENLTAFRQKNPIIDASNPWSGNFDATMVYGPLHGAIIYAGFRYTFKKY